MFVHDVVQPSNKLPSPWEWEEVLGLASKKRRDKYQPVAGDTALQQAVPPETFALFADIRHINACAMHEAQHCGFPPGKEVCLYLVGNSSFWFWFLGHPSEAEFWFCFRFQIFGLEFFLEFHCWKVIKLEFWFQNLEFQFCLRRELSTSHSVPENNRNILSRQNYIYSLYL